METWTRRTALVASGAFLLVWLAAAVPVMADEKSFFSPIIDVDPKRGFIFISGDGGIVIVKASDASMPHLKKIPIMGMIDLVAEVKPGHKVVYLKSWKIVAGESDCKVFDGKACK